MGPFSINTVQSELNSIISGFRKLGTGIKRNAGDLLSEAILYGRVRDIFSCYLETIQKEEGSKELKDLILKSFQEIRTIRKTSILEKEELRNCLHEELIRFKNKQPSLTPLQKMALRVEEVRLAHGLGVQPVSAPNSTTGALILKGLDEKTSLGLFKPLQEKQSLFWKWLEEIFKFLIGRYRQIHYCRCDGTVPPLYAEVATSIASDFFNFRSITPHTIKARIGKLEGSFMEWIGGEFCEVSHAKKKQKTFSDAYSVPRIEEIQLFQNMVIFDYLIGNLDRHEDNWMVSQEKENGTITGIKLIDNSNTFLTHNPPESWLDRWIKRKQYLWRDFRLSNVPFTEQSKTIMSQFDKEKVCTFIRVAKEQMPQKDYPEINRFFSKELEERMIERATILKHAATQSMNPALLGKIRSDHAIKTFLNLKN